MDDPRDDIHFQILEHLRALRAEMSDVSGRLERLEKRLKADEASLGQPRVATAARAKTSDPAET